jgi:phosphoenolpyruvate carboxykinase (GTP)
MIARSRGAVGAQESPVGLIPFDGDLDLNGVNVSKRAWEQLFEQSPGDWTAELEDQAKFFGVFGERLPRELREEHEALKGRVAVLETVKRVAGDVLLHT